jgi:RHS repeat-associated protein
MVGTTSAGSSPHPFGYTGRRWDPDLGLYYYRARWYDPQLGTFLQTDPIGALDYVNLYAYVGLEPGNGTDPSGKTCSRTRSGTGSYLCRFDEVRPSGTKGETGRINEASRAYTSAVNRLLANPNRTVRVTLANGATGRFNAGVVAQALIGAKAVYEGRPEAQHPSAFANARGEGVPSLAGTPNGEGPTTITHFAASLSSSFNHIRNTWVHEGMHATPGDRTVTALQRFNRVEGGNGFDPISKYEGSIYPHGDQFNEAADALIR